MTFSIATRAQAITLKNCGCSLEDIKKQTGIGSKYLRYVIREAKKHGYDPEKSLLLKDEYFHDPSYRTGRPRKLSEEQTRALAAALRTEKGERTKTNAQLAKEFGVSAATITRFKRHGEYKKPAYRPQRKDSSPPTSQEGDLIQEAAQSQAGADADADGDSSMLSRRHTEESDTFENTLLEQLRDAATAGTDME